MEEIIIYKYQLKEIENALRLTTNMRIKEGGKETCYDRIVAKASKFTEEALARSVK